MTLSPTRRRGKGLSSLACASGSKVTAVVEYALSFGGNYLEGITRFCFAASYVVALALELLQIVWPRHVQRLLALAFGGAGLIAHTLYLAVQRPPVAGPLRENCPPDRQSPPCCAVHASRWRSPLSLPQ